MPLDKPTYLNEKEIVLTSSMITTLGNTSPALAIDDDPTTIAQFASASTTPKLLWSWLAPTSGPSDTYNFYQGATPGSETQNQTGLTALSYQEVVTPGSSYSAYVTGVVGGVEGAASNEVSFTVPSSPPNRFLTVNWGRTTLVTRIRLALTGAASNVDVGLLPGDGTEVAVAYGPMLPSFDGTVKDFVFNPPIMASGVIIHPDGLSGVGSAASYPAVGLNQIQVYEQNYTGATIIMPLPTVQWTQVGVQAIAMFPWNGAAGPYDVTTRCNLFGLQTADIGITVDTVEGKGGESVWDIFSAEVARDIEIKLSAFKIDFNTWKVLMGGRLTLETSDGAVNAGSGAGTEVQAHSPNFTDRAPDLRLFIQTTVGDGQVTILLPRLKAKGAINFPMKAKEMIVPDWTLKAKWDPTYIAQDGLTGGICDFFYGDKGQLAFHS